MKTFAERPWGCRSHEADAGRLGPGVAMRLACILLEHRVALMGTQ